MQDWKKTLVSPDAAIADVVSILDHTVAEICLVTDSDGRLIGTVTDGDIRRGTLRKLSMQAPVSFIMNDTPLSLTEGHSSDEIAGQMVAREVLQIPILDADGRVCRLMGRADLGFVPSENPNWIVLMAGGLGSRLRPLTETVPKPMLEIGGRPVLDTIIQNFVKHGFRRFYVSVNYKRDMIMDYFGDGSDLGIEIRYLEEDKAMGTAGPLSLIQERPTEPFFVMNSDLLTLVDLEKMLSFHREHRAVASMAVREYDFQVPFGVVNIEQSRIVSIDEKPVHSFFVNAGIYVLEPGALDFVPNDSFFDMPTLFSNLVEAEKETTVFPIREYWLDIGRIDDFNQAQREYDETFTVRPTKKT